MFFALSATTSGNGAQLWMTLAMIVVVVLFTYFGIMRPQKKQAKETRALLDSLTVGDEITTIGGIIGKIVYIKGETCIIETGREHTRIRILKSAVRCVDVHAEDAD